MLVKIVVLGKHEGVGIVGDLGVFRVGQLIALPGCDQLWVLCGADLAL